MSIELRSLPAPADSPLGQTVPDDYQAYRAVSSLAIVSVVLGCLSIMVLLDPFVLALVPLAGITTGVMAWRSIRRYPDELTGETWVGVGIGLSALFLAAGWSYYGYVYATEVPPGHERISYAQLYLSEEDLAARRLPESAKALHGQRVFIKGYVFPGAQSTGIRRFVLVRDNGSCCFGGPAPPPGDMILVNLREGLELKYSTRLHKVAGVLRVAPTVSDDVSAGVVYQIDADHAW